LAVPSIVTVLISLVLTDTMKYARR
jgi:hypothetical protein